MIKTRYNLIIDTDFLNNPVDFPMFQLAEGPMAYHVTGTNEWFAKYLLEIYGAFDEHCGEEMGPYFYKTVGTPGFITVLGKVYLDNEKGRSHALSDWKKSGIDHFTGAINSMKLPEEGLKIAQDRLEYFKSKTEFSKEDKIRRPKMSLSLALSEIPDKDTIDFAKNRAEEYVDKCKIGGRILGYRLLTTVIDTKRTYQNL